MNDPNVILYVDDDDDDLDVMAEVIKDLDPEVKVITAHNGVEALDYLYAARGTGNALPCLVLLDLNMPMLDGHETCKRIKGEVDFSALPVVIFTSGGNPNDKKFYSDQGIEYITKPFDLHILTDIANNMLLGCRQRGQ